MSQTPFLMQHFSARVLFMTTLEAADVESLIHLLATAADPTVEIDLANRKRQLLVGVGRMIAADVWIWFLSRIAPHRQGDAVPISAVDGGWLDENERQNALRVMVHPELQRTVTAVLHEAVVNDRSHTISRTQLMDDATWFATEAGQAWRTTGFNHFVVSAYPIGHSIVSACGFHRRYGKPAFSEREKTIVHVMFQQVDWLHRQGSDVPAPKSVIDLSPRERQVMLLLIGGDSRKQVAAKLKLSQHTVADYLKEIYRKLNVSSRAELLAKFIAGGK